MPLKKCRLHFYADENIPLPTVHHLKSKGITITHVVYLHFVGKSDPFHLKESKKRGCVLLSLDKDLKRFNDAKLAGHPGIILLTVGNAVPENVNRVLDKLLKRLPDEVHDSLIRASVDKITRIKDGVQTRL